ncbi:hypothetical protein ACEQUB_01663 [Ralstonia syzygii]
MIKAFANQLARRQYDPWFVIGQRVERAKLCCTRFSCQTSMQHEQRGHDFTQRALKVLQVVRPFG